MLRFRTASRPAYLNGGFGGWEFAFTALVTFFAFHGLHSYRFIGVGWLLHTGWDVLHNLYGTPIVAVRADFLVGLRDLRSAHSRLVLRWCACCVRESSERSVIVSATMKTRPRNQRPASRRTGAPATVDEYFVRVPEPRRSVLTTLQVQGRTRRIQNSKGTVQFPLDKPKPACTTTCH